MKIKELITKIDKSKRFESNVDIYYMANEIMDLNLICNDNEQTRLISYYFGNWLCTDTWVGYKVYFLDDEPVAVSSQTGRKMNEKIEWLSKEAYTKVRDYVLTFMDKEENEPNIELCNLEEEVGETYKIEFNSQLFDHHKENALYKKENVKIIDFHKGVGFNEKKQYQPSLVKIKFKNKTEDWVEVKELDFPYNIIKQ